MMEASLEITTLESGGEILQARRAVYEYETQPYAFSSPPWDSQDEWIRNSPAFNLGSVSTPMLLLVGEFDFAPRSMERVYSVLRGRGVPVKMAQYWGESHVIASPGNLFDTWTRSENFFRRYLRME